MIVLAASARLDADDVLRIRWAEPPADDTTLTLRREGTVHTVRLDGEVADLSQLDLTDGTWSVHAADAEVATTDPGFSLDGLVEYARRSRTRALRTFRDPSGGLRVGVRSVTPYAEVTTVHPGEEKLVLEGFLAYGATPAADRVVATRRKTGDTVIGEATVTGDRWHAELPNASFAVETERNFWDLEFGGLTVATWLDDIPEKKTKVRFPARHVARDTDRVRVRAYYTDQDELAIATTVVANAEAS
ncbi:hypothetical protein NE236_29065 [Actinoallomurus purpureus]|uniref:hypothetical protein n=1 Tax=Actinoallomurus purpureus TaxID=478114 RepID=UPI0020935EBC|nr:hypothetical protein [Actinoallomurus purpureus]MCO6009031.1 hypothetical protein [Actinoallomurus purpureus]